jgi:hypothetical protein
MAKDKSDKNKVSSEEAESCNELMHYYEQLVGTRSLYENLWDEITEYFMAGSGTKIGVNSRSDPSRKSRKCLNNAPGMAAKTLTARIISEMTGPTTRWFELRAKDPAVDKIDPIRRLLQGLTDEIFSVLDDDSFQLAHIESTYEWVVYGTSCVLRDRDINGKRFYRAIPLKEIYIDENAKGEVDIVFRKFVMTCRQLVQFFGEDKIPEDILEEGEEDPTQEWEVLHCVMPNEDYDDKKKKASSFRYKSVYLLPKVRKELRVGYFKRNPYIVFRFGKRPGEVYGSAPTVDCLADVRMLNKLEEEYLRAVQLNGRPPILAPHDSSINPVRIVPGGITYGAMGSDGTQLLKPLLPQRDSERSLKDLMELKIMHIRSAFFIDPLINRENSIRTAAEVQKRSSEELIGLTPPLARYKVEYLTAIIGLELADILEKKKIKFPPELGGVPDLDFSSPLEKTQQSQQLANLMQFGQIMQMLGQVDPGILQNIDFNNYLRTIADLLTTPMQVLRSPEEMQAMAAKQEQQMQQQQMLQGLQGAAQTGTDMAKAGLIGRQDLGLPGLPQE